MSFPSSNIIYIAIFLQELLPFVHEISPLFVIFSNSNGLKETILRILLKFQNDPYCGFQSDFICSKVAFFFLLLFVRICDFCKSRGIHVSDI